MKYITHLIHFEGPSDWRDEEEDDNADYRWPDAHDNPAPTEATGDELVSPVEADHAEADHVPGTALDLVPSPKAEPAALEATGSEEISVKVLDVDIRVVDGHQVECDGGKTLERTMSRTSTVTMPDCDGDFFKLPSETAELKPMPQLIGGYMNNNATCILLGLPLSDSGHYQAALPLPSNNLYQPNCHPNFRRRSSRMATSS